MTIRKTIQTASAKASAQATQERHVDFAYSGIEPLAVIQIAATVPLSTSAQVPRDSTVCLQSPVPTLLWPLLTRGHGQPFLEETIHFACQDTHALLPIAGGSCIESPQVPEYTRVCNRTETNEKLG